MKRLRLSALVLTLALALTSCSADTEPCMTVAAPFDDSMMEQLQLQSSAFKPTNDHMQLYETSDGRRVLYLYSAPVEQADGALVENDASFVVEGDYVAKDIPKNLSESHPIQIRDSDDAVQIFLDGYDGTGKAVERRNAFGQTHSAVLYEDAFGPGVDYYCYPTPFGVNTEIVVDKPGGAGTFQIRMRLPRLTPDTDSPDYILFRDDGGAVHSILYTPLVCDADQHWSYDNTVKLIEKDSDTNTYTVEYTVDEAFLSDQNIQFPLVLNQSVYLYRSKQPDTSVYQDTTDEAGHYLSPYMLLGDQPPKGEGWTYIRYEVLDQLNLDPDKIVSAHYIFRTLLDTDKEMKIGAYAVTSDWCSINTRWYNRPAYDETPVDEVLVKQAGDYRLDITPLFVQMISGTNPLYSVENSFLIRSDTADSRVLAASGDSGLFSPLLEIVLSA